MKIKEIVEILNKHNLISTIKGNLDYEKEIENITYDSRECKEGTMFFVKGATFKEEYLVQAVEKNISAVVTEIEYNVEGIGMIIVNNIRKAMVVIAGDFFGNAYKDFNLIGITGTKGKTTTTYFLKNIIEEATKKRVGILSTIEVYTGKREEDSHLTTPEAIELQRYFKEMKDSKLDYAIMEASSQAYKTDRIYNMRFNTGVFLNISADHISVDEHPDFEDYLNCKLKFIETCDTVIINKETNYFDAVLLASKTAQKIITYGTNKSSKTADYYIESIEKGEGFYEALVKGKNGYSLKFKITMQGRFNIENALAAIIVAKEYNIDDESIKRGLEKTSVKGRMNIFEKDGVLVIVDYAHNELSFNKFFETLRLDYPGRNVITVAGGPGGKAPARRKDLGLIAGAHSSYIYLTAEDPQYEQITDICEEIASYIKCPYEIIEDRTEAIEKAISNAKSGDIVALLAKGEETYQKVKGLIVPYESDLLVAKRLMTK